MVPEGAKFHMTLGGKGSVQEVFNLRTLGNEFMIPEIGLHTRVFFETSFRHERTLGIGRK